MSNISVLEHIQDYCIRIENAITRFGDSEDVFLTDREYRDAVCMNILQIGELTTLLSDDFKSSTEREINWVKIKRMRNLFAHAYHQVKSSIVWETVKNNIPGLKLFCEEQINYYNALEQDGDETFDEEEDLEL